MTHAARAHAKLSPSSAARWMACPGSIRASEGILDTSSRYADEGTAAHMLCERALAYDKDASFWLGETIIVSHERNSAFVVDEEMVEGARLYVDTVRGIAARAQVTLVEERFDLTHIAEGMFGTGDFVAYIADDAELVVVDFKYGRGHAVEAKENPQLILYGIGAVKRHHNYPLKSVRLIVVQPRAPHPLGPVREWVTDAVDLLEREADMREAAERTKSDVPVFEAGEWCTFCKAAPTCDTFAAKALTAAQAEFAADGAPVLPEVARLSPERLGAILSQADLIEDWCRRVREFAHLEASHGRMPAGFKFVAKRATRKWRDEEQARATLAMVAEEDDLFQRSFKSPAQVEKVLGKKSFAAFEHDLVVKESTGTVLASIDDPRPAVQAVDAAAEFAA